MINIPELTELHEVAEKYSMTINELHDPAEEFELYDLERQSAITCIITTEQDLFSIDVHNPDRQVFLALKDVLQRYNLPTENFIELAITCFNSKEYDIKEYSDFWVEFRAHEIDILLIRYRRRIE
ncbi:hypothetical protein [Paenibacillus periandrae]|uniref:hypothetical protein n=1 Tax=Paenibacillus periandrae TaxID=1761741 RepID=UPI001F095493|nr:hypothetical protein [Paenibacillus periandrae]